MGLFGFSLSSWFFINNNKAGPNTDDNHPQQANTKARSPQQATQQRLRRQRRREREEEAERLDQLEAEDAATSDRAKIIDQESLKLLEQATRRREESKRAKMVYKARMKKLERAYGRTERREKKRYETPQKATEVTEKREKRYDTPQKAASCPATPLLQGRNGTPLSYAPSFSTPVSAGLSASSESESKQDLIREVEVNRWLEILAKSERRGLRGATSGSPGRGGGGESKGSGADFVLELYDEIEKKDAEEGWTEVGEESIEYLEAPESVSQSDRP